MRSTFFGRLLPILPIALLIGLPAPGRAAGLRLEPVAGPILHPVDITHAGDGSGRLFIVSQDGVILIHDGSRVLPTPFLDIIGKVACCGERGLTGLAFHPDYEKNGFFFVAYTNNKDNAVIARFSVSADADVADRNSELKLLTIEQPFTNHNNGDLAFGPDGYLYVGTGDGGPAGDPNDLGQNTSTLLGKILRIDVDSATPYAIPPDNPLRSTPGAQPEIWAFGLRNPWRLSFDRLTGDLFIGDVGERTWEEVNFQPAASSGGQNYGWKRMEGNACFDPPSNCDDGSLVRPIVQYSHAIGCSVIGGFRYRGPEVPTLSRFYIFGDFCTGRIWGARPDSSGRWRSTLFDNTGLFLVTFGEDEEGNLYVADRPRNSTDGRVFRLVGEPLFSSGFESGSTIGWSKRRGNVAVIDSGLGGSSNALEVTVDGSGRRSYVQAKHGFNRDTFAVGFSLNVNQVALGAAEVEILRLVGGVHHVALTLAQEGSKYFVYLYARDEGGALTAYGRTRIPKKRTVRLDLDWFRATGAGAAGEVRLLENGKIKAVAADLDNAAFSIKSVRLGLPAGSAGAVGGSFLIDDYQATP